jgi:hypothetical protein
VVGEHKHYLLAGAGEGDVHELETDQLCLDLVARGALAFERDTHQVGGGEGTATAST